MLLMSQKPVLGQNVKADVRLALAVSSGGLAQEGDGVKEINHGINYQT